MFVEDGRSTGSTNGGSNPHPQFPKKPVRKKIPNSNDKQKNTEKSKDSHVGNFSLDNVVEDVVVCIFSLLSPSEISACRCVNKRFYDLCSDDSTVWMAMCERRWGAKTEVRKWGSGKILYKLLYGILERWENLVGFWRGVGHGGIGPLACFDWGDCCLIGSRIMPLRAASYEVRKVPFLWLGVSAEGTDLCFIDPDCIPHSMVGKERRIRNPFENWEDGVVEVKVNFVGNCHIVVEEKEDRSWVRNWQSYPDGLQMGLYDYFASKVSLGGGDRSWRKQRRKEKERRKWEQEHFVKIVDCCPTPARPLQGLWKGITDSMSLEFILVSYDACDGIVCRQVGGSSQYVSGYGSVFWTADSTSFARFPLSAEEEELYNCRTHIRPVDAYQTDGKKYIVYEDVEITQVLHINSNSDLFRHRIGVSSSNNMEGRLWQYTNGKFGLAFLNNNSIVDFQYICSSGNLLDVAG